ncbi:MAG TPA: MiaB/RimO family radical SAM methylthiotransferase, partial [Candidatus Fimivicinus intestinavium]|nr:MiaB/RimO family radical SAM methylthiotransferase [Candidatus Fimivicinus intestinavium]
DGCSNCCSYCAIPGIRGPFRSRRMERIVEEAQELAASGVKELILVAQDTTRYGEDLYGALMLPELLTRLCQVEGIEWIRLLYCYPERITDALLETIAREPKVLHYLDIPLQHCDAQILRRMNRSGSRESLAALIAKIRAQIPDIVLRTTVMTGFPGEDEAAFTELAEFVKEQRFDRLGCFAYSQEEGTAAAAFPDQVDEEVKQHRAELILQDQYDIVEANNRARIGKTFRAVVEDYDAYTDSYTGRTWMDAPEIDGTVRFTCGYPLNDGDFVDVEIFDVSDYDLIGEVV